MKHLFAFILVFLLIGCGAGTTASDPRNFDLGIDAPGAKLPPARIGPVRAAAPFEATDMQYRLAYRNPAEIAAFAHSRWAAAPAELFRKQLLRAANEQAARCGLRVEIQEFTQVFTAKEASEARIELRVWLGTGPERAVSRGWSVVEPNAGPDAVSGAAAMARAANRAVSDIGTWIAAQPDCR